MNVLVGADFFTLEVLSWRGLVTYYVLCSFIWKAAASAWRVSPDIWIKSGWSRSPAAPPRRRGPVFIHAAMFCMIAKRSSAHRFGRCWRRRDSHSVSGQEPESERFCAERWVRSAKQECLSRLILFGERPLSRVLAEFSAHYHGERNHQGKGNQLLFPEPRRKPKPSGRTVECRHRLGGLLKYDVRAACVI